MGNIERRIRLGVIAGVSVLFALAVVVLTVDVAKATPAGAHVVESTCTNEWYVNADEVALLPLQTEDGFVFDGPSLVHHQTDILMTALNGVDFEVEVLLGVEPLFKVETSPYSTLNYVGGGKWWSSRIAPGDPGGQDNPVTPAVMATLPIIDKSWDDATSYSAETRVISFGVGYANDTGNKALVSSITFQGQTYDLTCSPQTEPPTTPPATGEPTTAPPTTPPATNPPATVEPSSTVPPVAGGPNLPVTGVSIWTLGGAGLVLIGLGALVWGLFRPKRVRTTL
jgi:hypothetical protein